MRAVISLARCFTNFFRQRQNKAQQEKLTQRTNRHE